MPLLLTRDDLRPLLSDPTLIAAGLDAIATCLTRPDEPGTSAWWAFPLAVPPTHLNVHAMTTGPDGTVLRAWPTDRQSALDHGLSLLFDREHGQPLAILGGGEYLMWRTAGPVVLACRHLAPAGSRTVAMLGTGIQARHHLVGLRQALPDLEAITVYSRDPGNRRAFAEHAAAATGLTVRAGESAREAVEGAEVIISTAGTVEPVLDPAWVRPGALVTDIFLGVPRDLPARVVTTHTPYPARPPVRMGSPPRSRRSHSAHPGHHPGRGHRRNRPGPYPPRRDRALPRTRRLPVGHRPDRLRLRLGRRTPHRHTDQPVTPTAQHWPYTPTSA
jgi:hypothetical protein